MADEILRARRHVVEDEIGIDVVYVRAGGDSRRLFYLCHPLPVYRPRSWSSDACCYTGGSGDTPSAVSDIRICLQHLAGP